MSLFAKKQVLQIRDLIFFLAVTLLILNDASWKWTYRNELTGKLSDFAGLLAFALFWIYLFPKRKILVLGLTAIGFLWWKSIYSQSFIDSWNSWSPLGLYRVVDPSDLWALIVLPLIYLCFQQRISLSWRMYYPRLIGYLTMILAFTSFSATSVYRHAFPQGDVHIGERYNLKISSDSVLARMDRMGISYQVDTSVNLLPYNTSYLIDSLPLAQNELHLPEGIYNIQMTLNSLSQNKSSIFIRDINLTNDPNVSDWRVLRDLRNQYEQKIRKRFIQKLKQE